MIIKYLTKIKTIINIDNKRITNKKYANMPQKNLFIGNYKVRNCLQYGEYKVISSLGLGDDVILEYLPSDKLIVVKDIVNKVILGELEVPEHIRKILVASLSSNHNHTLYECRVSSIDNQRIDSNRFYVSVWMR